MIVVDAVQTGKNIRYFRKERGFTAKEFCKRMHVNVPVMYSWESGTRVPSIETMYNICDVLGVEMCFIVKTERV